MSGHSSTKALHWFPITPRDSLHPGHPVLMFFEYCQAWVLIPNPSLRSLRNLPTHSLSFYPAFPVQHGMSRARDAEQRRTKTVANKEAFWQKKQKQVVKDSPSQPEQCCAESFVPLIHTFASTISAAVNSGKLFVIHID